MPKPKVITRQKQDIILALINKALEYQFEIYSWANMIDDIPDLTPEERKWAKENTGYKAYFTNRR